MVTTLRSFSGFSVDDVAAALPFYRDTLGLPARENAMGGFEIDLTEGSSVFVYPKGEAHVPASYTVLNLVVPDIDAAVTELEAAGVHLLRYPEFDQDDRGVARSTDPAQGPTIGWISDPAGNVIALIQE
ncbi:VOC family protein [Myceligenerans xiligouense]|uniref:Putative enzyme related to lactoylglutathione lyase n=1 Tax=Myceligenerans xiligouense TaxID=253184 RepID=A0A3N4YJW0_9MICO|nr:VOC family protein [Myceligenerans xiligouense]RPF20387.1 putative enzyme related to lactoylglutathione lyase [Myceligenerans xiligouense]